MSGVVSRTITAQFTLLGGGGLDRWENLWLVSVMDGSSYSYVA